MSRLLRATLYVLNSGSETLKSETELGALGGASQMLATAPTTSCGRAPPVDFTALIRLFAASWGASGHPVPGEYDNEEGFCAGRRGRKGIPAHARARGRASVG